MQRSTAAITVLCKAQVAAQEARIMRGDQRRGRPEGESKPGQEGAAELGNRDTQTSVWGRITRTRGWGGGRRDEDRER